tara:strand:- start:31970 stop:32332 length:363 start_codon:yes stop_codon:yes gene_type:complete
MEAILDKIWGVFVALFWWMLNRLTSKIDELEKGKASGNDLNGIRKNLSDDMTGVKQGLRELDRRVDEIDHATQLRLVPRDEIKGDVTLLHQRCNDLSERLCQKEDRIKTIRVTENEKKGK